MPIKVPNIEEALGISATEAIEEYSVWGGMPRCWDLREGYAVLREAIKEN